jgi:elongation factor Ts
MEITAGLVKQLRDKTGAGMMDCKRALIETDGDMEAALEHLRKKGLMEAAKKSSRTAADGLVAFAISDNKKEAVLVEINSETDFVAKNDKFQEVAENVAKAALFNDNPEDLLKAKYPSADHSVKEEIDHLISIVGENITLRRIKKISANEGIIATYVHSALKPSMGKIGVLVAIGSKAGDETRLIDFGRKVAMHIAAANPSYLSLSDVPESVLNKEKEIILAQAKEMGKNADIAAKMAEGRIKKYAEESVLLDQIYVIDNKTKISEVVASFGKEIGSSVEILAFEKFVLGEGIMKEESNFALEVMSFAK